MTDLTAISSFLLNSANAIVGDAKFLTSVLVGTVATAAAVMRNLAEISEDRAKRATEKVETEKVAALLDLLVKLPPSDSFSACRKELELQLAHGLGKLDAVRIKALKRAHAPNRDLTFLQRLFVFFPPVSRLSWVAQGLAYLFMAGGPLTILMLVFFRIGDAATLGDLVVLIVFGSLAFRAWALAERKWAMEPDKSASAPIEGTRIEASPLAALFVLRKSIGWKMLIGQICMWTCMFCAVESLEDILLAGMDANAAATHADEAKAAKGAVPAQLKAQNDENVKNDKLLRARNDAKGGLLLFLTSLLAAAICGAWASSELRSGAASPHIVPAQSIFPVWKPAIAEAWLLRMGCVAAAALLIESVVFWSRIFDDQIDRIEFAFVWMAACVAFSRLLSCCAQRVEKPVESEAAGWSRTAAA